MTDAQHGHRYNAKDTSVVALGERKSTVICHKYIKKHEDDHVSQRYRKIGRANL